MKAQIYKIIFLNYLYIYSNVMCLCNHGNDIDVLLFYYTVAEHTTPLGCY